MTGLTVSGDCTVGGEKKGLAVLLMKELACLDVGTDTFSGPEAPWQPLGSFPAGSGPVCLPFISASPSACTDTITSVVLLPGGVSRSASSSRSSWNWCRASSSCSSLTGRKCLSCTTLSSVSSSLWKSLAGSSMISPTERTLAGVEKTDLSAVVFFKFRSLSFSSLLLSAHVSLLDGGFVFTFSALSSSDLSPQLSSVKALTLCLRRLKSWTPLDLELEGTVSWAAMIWLLTRASFSSFSDKLALLVRSKVKHTGENTRKKVQLKEKDRGVLPSCLY